MKLLKEEMKYIIFYYLIVASSSTHGNDISRVSSAMIHIEKFRRKMKKKFLGFLSLDTLLQFQNQTIYRTGPVHKARYKATSNAVHEHFTFVEWSMFESFHSTNSIDIPATRLRTASEKTAQKREVLT